MISQKKIDVRLNTIKENFYYFTNFTIFIFLKLFF